MARSTGKRAQQLRDKVAILQKRVKIADLQDQTEALRAEVRAATPRRRK